MSTAPLDPGRKPERIRPGRKRIFLGGLGAVLSLVGFVVVPQVLAVLGVIAAGTGALQLDPLDPAGATFSAESTAIYAVTVPSAEADAVTCEITGADVDVTHTAAKGLEPGELDGVTYQEIYEIVPSSAQEISVACEGASAVALSTLDLSSSLAGSPLRWALPAVALAVSLALLAWGLVALRRSLRG
ncbi:hypothetical protein [Brachybacterium sp. YJGR34]|uniref:hypothetical protein n=1 Tax=Brachybacterium sp. YJGR34 TaxID=2059911 RepID=UPI000E0AB063|nr:hypothetical protein [Brachybacterium sp. YJGR34]